MPIIPLVAELDPSLPARRPGAVIQTLTSPSDDANPSGMKTISIPPRDDHREWR